MINVRRSYFIWVVFRAVKVREKYSLQLLTEKRVFSLGGFEYLVAKAEGFFSLLNLSLVITFFLTNYIHAFRLNSLHPGIFPFFI